MVMMSDDKQLLNRHGAWLRRRPKVPPSERSKPGVF
jgi:hypothetical protein